MEELYPGVYRVFPTKITDSKYCSFFVKRRGGNLLFPCLAGHSNIEGSFDAMEKMNGVAYQLIGDMHFAARYNDDITARFGVNAMCSDIEGPDVKRKVKHVMTFPFRRHMITANVEAIPTPGHRPGAVCYLLTLAKTKYLFAGDTIYHDKQRWRCYTSKKNKNTMIETLDLLADTAFDVLFANTQVSNPICSIGLNEQERRGLMERIRQTI